LVQDAALEEVLPQLGQFGPAGELPLVDGQDLLEGGPVADSGLDDIGGSRIEAPWERWFLLRLFCDWTEHSRYRDLTRRPVI
jgi:hypothetical protein